MYPQIEQQVEQLFDEALRRTPKTCICENPVTGENFVPGHDPVRPHKQRAIRALIAQLRFADEKSAEMLDLPINERGYSGTWKWQSPRHYVVEAFTYSLRCRDAELLSRYPPKPLKGLGSGLVFTSR